MIQQIVKSLFVGGTVLITTLLTAALLNLIIQLLTGFALDQTATAITDPIRLTLSVLRLGLLVMPFGLSIYVPMQMVFNPAGLLATAAYIIVLLNIDLILLILLVHLPLDFNPATPAQDPTCLTIHCLTPRLLYFFPST